MWTEDDLRSALYVRERETPAAETVLQHVTGRPSAGQAGRGRGRGRGRECEREDGRWREGGREGVPGRRLIAAAAAAAAVIAVVAASVAIADGAHAPGSARQAAAGQAADAPTAPQAADLSLRSVPRYYLTLIPSGKSVFGPQYAVIRDTATGATLATIRPPVPFGTFSAVTGAADDRTFVLAAQRWTGGSQGVVPNLPVKFFGVRFNPANGKVTMAPLAIPETAAGSLETGLALSPDGTRLAVAVTAGDNLQEVRVYSLASGAVRVWQDRGTVGYSADDSVALSWAASGPILAFDWTSPSKEVASLSPADGLRLLNTAATGGSLLADSRLAVSVSQPGGRSFSWDAVLTPDGTKVVAALGLSPSSPKSGVPTPPLHALPSASPPADRVQASEFEEFSARTGNPVYVLYPLRSRPSEIDWLLAGAGVAGLAATAAASPESVLWSNSSGSVLIVEAPTASGRQSVLGVLSGNRLIPIPGAPAVFESDMPVAF